MDGLLDLAKSTASQRISQELLDRTYSQAKRFIDEEDYESAVQLLRRALRQVDEPVLHRQLEEANQKHLAIEQRADAALERAENLMRMELFAEAVLLLEEQSPGVKRLPRIDQALARARKLQEAEADFAGLTGRCYAQMGTTQGVADLKRALNTPASSDAPDSQEATKSQLRRRCEQIYGEKASSAIGAARELLGQDDSAGAEALLKETLPWLELSPGAGAARIARSGSGSGRRQKSHTFPQRLVAVI